MIAGLNMGDSIANGSHYSGSFMTTNPRRGHWIEPTHIGNIAVAQSGCSNIN
jgi:hypothetical protein